MGEKDFSDRALVGDDSLSYVSRDMFRAVREGITDPIARAEVLADLCRINTLFMIMQAGSGHCSMQVLSVSTHVLQSLPGIGHFWTHAMSLQSHAITHVM